MNWDQIKRDWKQVARRFKEKWGQITDNDHKVFAGRRQELVLVLQDRYGYGKGHAEKNANSPEWLFKNAKFLGQK